jgi:hypothetical protein
LISCSHLAIYECTDYIPDMSCEDSKRARHRQRQAHYEARLRDGIGLFPIPLRASEIDVLISLNYLPELTSTRELFDDL